MIKRNINYLYLYSHTVNVPSYYNGAIILNEEERSNYINQVKNLISQPKQLNFGKLVYTGNTCSVPRFKLKQYFADNKIKRTSRQEHCDTIIIDKNNLISILKTLEEDRIRPIIYDGNIDLVKDMLNSFVKNRTGGSSWVVDSIKKVIPKLTSENTIIELASDYPTWTDFHLKNLINSSDIKEVWCYTLYRDKVVEDMMGMLDFLNQHPNINVIFDEHILELLNLDGIELDNEYLDTLHNMFASKQNDSIRLAVEMLSNVNLEKDALTIALLLNKYQEVFNHGSGITPSSMNSFKSIDKYYKSRGIKWKTDWRPFSKSLYKNYSHNPEHKKIIEDFVMRNINRYLNENMAGMQFNIKSFDLAFQ